MVKFDQFRDDRMEFLSEMLDRGGFCGEADDIFTGGDPDANFWVPEGVNGVGGSWDHGGVGRSLYIYSTIIACQWAFWVVVIAPIDPKIDRRFRD
jgi:hypothetical protein